MDVTTMATAFRLIKEVIDFRRAQTRTAMVGSLDLLEIKLNRGSQQNWISIVVLTTITNMSF